MAEKKTKKEQKTEETKPTPLDALGNITNKSELNTFLVGLRDRLADESASPIQVLSAMHYVLRQPTVYECLDNENKEIARDIWLRLKKSGMQLRNPPMLFSAEESASI